MHPLMSTFHDGQRLLAANSSVAMLTDPAIPVAAKLAVVPTMSFWVLAFGDAMALIRRTAGSHPLDAVLRQHAEEDAEHWRWFVSDLETLASQGIGAPSVGAALLRQWGAATAPVRECAWVVHHLLRSHTDPVIRLAILEACEDGFEAFMGCMRPVILAAGQYQRLRYLGAIHDHAEASHALHELDDPLDGVDWSTRDVDGIRSIVRQVYRCLDGMHACYTVAIQQALDEAAGETTTGPPAVGATRDP